ncbi:M23 family metallopeptidase [Streptomyces sp. BBFR102]|uniref:M23 family metallopeptidase n=1 Tax=Streptomyces sp. BBFR102 TaxID=3448171 RepID=UPI003F52B2B7
MLSRRSLRAALTALAATAGLLTAVPAAAAAPEGPAAASPSAGVTVKMADTAADRLGTARQALVDAVSADVLARSHDAGELSPGTAVARLAEEGREVVVDVRAAKGDWARGVAYVEAPRDHHGGPEGWLFLAQRENGKWVPGLEGDEAFADHVAASPLVGEAERKTMTAYAEREAQPGPIGTRANVNGLLLPWAPDTVMTLTGGPHTHGGSGNWSSLDFAGGTGEVRPSREGTATSMCGSGGGWTRVIHPGGYSTDYYHMHNTAYFNGTAVSGSTRLGSIGVDTCAGGYATGPHVHWSLRTYDANLNGAYTWLNGRTIGGWAWYNGNAEYSGCATRQGLTACPGTVIYNRHA